MKRKTKITEEKVQQILAEQLGNISEDGAANLPSISTMRRNIRKVREDDNSSQIPVNLENTPVLSNEYQLIKSGEPFLTMVKGIQKGCLSLLKRSMYASFQSRNTGLLMKDLESNQKVFFQYILSMHSNTEKFSRTSLAYCQTKLKQRASYFKVKLIVFGGKVKTLAILYLILKDS